MTRPLLLDLFCGAGGAAIRLRRGVHAEVHQDKSYPDLIPATRAMLERWGLPYVVENLPAGVPDGFQICGSGLGLVVNVEHGKHRSGPHELRRHRRFASNRLIFGAACVHNYPVIGVYGHGGEWNHPDPSGGGYQAAWPDRQRVMGIDWMSRGELAEAIPPAYTELIGAQLLELL